MGYENNYHVPKILLICGVTNGVNRAAMTLSPDSPPILVWFRDDLRLADNPALHTALEEDQPVFCVYVRDDVSPQARRLGGASCWWLHQSLTALSSALAAKGGRLDVLRGKADEQILALVQSAGIRRVHWNRRYDPASIASDSALKAALQAQGVEVKSFNANLLHEPWELKPTSGPYFKVFTPYWKAARARGAPASPLPAPEALAQADWPRHAPARVGLADLNLLPTKPDWAEGLRDRWEPGETGARERLGDFLDDQLAHYSENRDFPARDVSSRLSPHLRFGEISPRQIYHAVQFHAEQDERLRGSADKFLSEIGWREFSYALLYHFPKLATDNYNARFDGFTWATDTAASLTAWQRGQTGYPIVDAGMRELWLTGTMHNRVRMVVASFLVKHLRIDWRAGEDWFWDTLCDADPASNPASWQWVAGSGADAAPYFRIFNPVLQGEKFDAEGAYIRTYVPELALMPAKWIHKPWDAPPDVLLCAKVTLGRSYPHPIVDHAAARDAALKAFKAL